MGITPFSFLKTGINLKVTSVKSVLLAYKSICLSLQRKRKSVFILVDLSAILFWFTSGNTGEKSKQQTHKQHITAGMNVQFQLYTTHLLQENQRTQEQTYRSTTTKPVNTLDLATKTVEFHELLGKAQHNLHSTAATEN